MQRPSVTVFFRRTLAAVTVALLALMAPLPAAFAHDSLISSSPEDGQSFETVPEEIKLTFTDTPIALGSEIKVQDEEGKDWAIGDVEIVDNVATQPIGPDAPGGKYTVTWRVVSSDSHPIEGVFEFTAASGGAGGAEVSTAQPVESPSAESGSQDQVSDTQEAPTTFPTSFVVIMGVILVVLVIIIGVLARKRLGRNDDAG